MSVASDRLLEEWSEMLLPSFYIVLPNQSAIKYSIRVFSPVAATSFIWIEIRIMEVQIGSVCAHVFSHLLKLCLLAHVLCSSSCSSHQANCVFFPLGKKLKSSLAVYSAFELYSVATQPLLDWSGFRIWSHLRNFVATLWLANLNTLVCINASIIDLVFWSSGQPEINF